MTTVSPIQELEARLLRLEEEVRRVAAHEREERGRLEERIRQLEDFCRRL